MFAAYAISNPAPPPTDGKVITVTPEIASRLAGQFHSTYQRPPSDDELEGMIDRFVREEVPVREALLLSLDQGDAAIRQRLVQKMRFLIEAAASAQQASDEALRARFEATRDSYALPMRLSFEQVFLGPQRGEAAVEETVRALAAGADPSQLGRPSLLPPAVSREGAMAIDRQFGPGFAGAVAEVEPGEWAGPVHSAYGVHIVRLRDLEPSVGPDFESVRDKVEANWRRENANALFEAQLEKVIAAYEVRRKHGTGGAGAAK